MENSSKTPLEISDMAGAIKYPKKKVAIIMAYLGTGYQGMQINPNAKTIESVLFKCLVDAGLVSELNAVDQKKIGLMRACRTDKGVHAAMQVVSLKLIIKDPLVEIVNSLNLLLPEDIRICGIHLVSQSFDSKLHCESRHYEYLIPTFMFMPNSSFDTSFLKTMNLERDEIIKSDNASNTNEDSSEVDEILEQDQTIKCSSKLDLNHKFDPCELNNFSLSDETGLYLSSFRLPLGDLEKLEKILNTFVGSHFFHNYTIKKASSDPSACRKIISFTTSKPFVLENPKFSKGSDNIMLESSEWIILTIHGQSFMLNQIRKLVGMVVMIMRLNVDDFSNLISRTLCKGEKMNIPKAPGLGLLLAQTCFSQYNKRLSDREQLDYETYFTEIDSFKKSEIYPSIAREEFSKNIFMNWWSAISCHSYDFKYLLEKWSPPPLKQPSTKKFKKGSHLSKDEKNFDLNGSQNTITTDTKEIGPITSKHSLPSCPQEIESPDSEIQDDKSFLNSNSN